MRERQDCDNGRRAFLVVAGHVSVAIPFDKKRESRTNSDASTIRQAGASARQAGGTRLCA
jgi:hypothetical protein